jgi:hypothetical protein
MLSTSSHEDARAEQGMDIKTTTALRSKFELCSLRASRKQRSKKTNGLFIFSK